MEMNENASIPNGGGKTAKKVLLWGLFALVIAGIVLASVIMYQKNTPDPLTEKNVVAEAGGGSEWSFDTFSLEGAVYQSDLIVTGTVTGIEKITFSDTYSGSALPSFLYSVTIEEVILDRGEEKAKAGNVIPFQAYTNGYIPAKDYDLYAKRWSSRLYLDPGEKRGENDYLRFTCGDTIPIEEGKTYVLFLRKPEGSDAYLPATQSQIHEWNGKRLKSGVDGVRCKYSLKELVKMIEEIEAKR